MAFFDFRYHKRAHLRHTGQDLTSSTSMDTSKHRDSQITIIKMTHR